VAPREGHDPHDDTPQIPAVQALKDEFWHSDGVVVDVCEGAPCIGDQY
jgi:putative intracellular protease/amidase